MTLYWAYGSNLNIQAMRQRCPAARPLGSFYLPNARLVFRGVADVVYARGESCPGGLWRITKECERTLDHYEGVSADLYSKVWMKVRITETGNISRVLVYQMNNDGIMPPGDHYYKTIQEGYRNFRLDMDYLQWALVSSWKRKLPNENLQTRRRRRGDNLTRIGLAS